MKHVQHKIELTFQIKQNRCCVNVVIMYLLRNWN